MQIGWHEVFVLYHNEFFYPFFFFYVEKILPHPYHSTLCPKCSYGYRTLLSMSYSKYNSNVKSTRVLVVE